MKTSSLSSKQVTLAMIIGSVALIASAAALNGGVALAASAFDGIATTIQGMLSSTMVITFALVALFAAIWQITHGKGYGMLAMVLGVLATAILGPNIVTSVATAERPSAIVQNAASLPAPVALK
jgi:hypothetical protein